METIKYYKFKKLARSAITASVSTPSSQYQLSRPYCTPNFDMITDTTKTLPAVDETVGPLVTFVNEGPKKWKSEYSRESFKAIKDSGVIKMTPYSVGTSQTTMYPVLSSRSVSPVGVGAATSFAGGVFYNNSCPDWPKYSWIELGPPAYDVQLGSNIVENYDHYSTLLEKNVPQYGLDITDNDYNYQVDVLKSQLVSELANDFDFLTTVAEFSETAEFVRSVLYSLRHPVKEAKRVAENYQRLSRRGKASQFGRDLLNRWMEYRYAIMPNVYAINDALKVINASGVYRTVRKSAFVTCKSRHISDDHVSFPYMETTGTYKGTLRATGKSRFDQEALRLSSSIAMNPLITAWEITKFSFVVDWFANVGDYIAAQSYSYMTTAAEDVLCMSFRLETDVNTHLRVPTVESQIPVPIERAIHARITPELQELLNKPILAHSSITGGGLVKSEMIDSYDRFLFNPSDVNLGVQPHLTWQRALDALALSNRQLSRFFRRLK